MTTAAAPLSVSHITKRYDDNLVLNDVSLSLNPGELFGLIGLNGVGKTTLIKIILDLTRPDQGQVQLFGEPCTEATARRHISYLPEKFQPSRYLRGRNTCLCACRISARNWIPSRRKEKPSCLIWSPKGWNRR